MATLDELKEKVLADDALLAEFKKAAETTEGLQAFLAGQGCDATAEEAMSFAKGGTGELADDELDDVAGGCSVYKEGTQTCPKCGGKADRKFNSYGRDFAICQSCGNKFTV